MRLSLIWLRKFIMVEAAAQKSALRNPALASASNDAQKDIAETYKKASASRPSWTRARDSMMTLRIAQLIEQRQNALKASGGQPTAEIKAIDLNIAKLETAFNSGMPMTGRLNEKLTECFKRAMPAAQPTTQTHDPSGSKTKSGLLNGQEARQKENRTREQAKFNGTTISGSGAQIRQVIAQQQAASWFQQKYLENKQTVRFLNNRQSGIERSEEEDYENEQDFETVHAEAIAAAEAAQQEPREITSETDLYKTLGVEAKSIEDPGLELAFNAKAAELSSERGSAIEARRELYLEGCANAGSLSETEAEQALTNLRSETKSALQGIEEKFNQGMQDLGQAKSTLSDGELRGEYHRTTPEANRPGEKGHPSLQPKAEPASPSARPTPPQTQ
ncbi:MAG: hypothetical protein P1U40_00320 [Coxiellaceae bacterium]|nr:hypothetical protein [Coxiellaceae bacterium]